MKQVRIDRPDSVYHGIMNLCNAYADHIVRSGRGVILKDLGNFFRKKGARPPRYVVEKNSEEKTFMKNTEQKKMTNETCKDCNKSICIAESALQLGYCEDCFKERQLYQRAIDKWGNALQVCMGIEEMAELTKELIKFFRQKTDFDKIAEEIADVEIMLNQLKIMFDNENIVKQKRMEKLERLKKMLE